MKKQIAKDKFCIEEGQTENVTKEIATLLEKMKYLVSLHELSKISSVYFFHMYEEKP